jgi:hypothetical protein
MGWCLKQLAVLFSLLCALVWAGPVQAQAVQQRVTGLGEISRDGAFIALAPEGTPQREFTVLELASSRSFRFALPEAHYEAKDFAWAPSSNTLLFTSGSVIWSVEFTGEGPQAAKVLATGKGVSLPALSPDGTKLGWFERIPLPDEESWQPKLASDGYGVFEKILASGAVARVSNSQYARPQRLYYETNDSWLFVADQPAYLSQMGGAFQKKRYTWTPQHPKKPSGDYSRDTDYIKSFRMERGESLPEPPQLKMPYPPIGVAPFQSRLDGVTREGHPILHGGPGPENTAQNRTAEQAKYYLRAPTGGVPVKMAYLGVAPDGTRTIYYPPELPAEWSNEPAGAGMAGNMTRYFKTAMKPYANGRDYGYESARLFVFDGEAMVVQRDIWDIIAKAMVVQVSE